ncbi:alpha-2-macroglobulin family protein [Parvularcula maris]|uniref:Alpha-2-macroglobulin family protein n=1 Tax=Parvularcula maris TaxID=2965077 RepID=A0A9X2RKF1_9PROT|nr:alpha-2-macroglobulin [Parvularcula maris]MCQ8185567.1 alpha-2-macroglobulin family protein [Parvularcula maris]
MMKFLRQWAVLAAVAALVSCGDPNERSSGAGGERNSERGEASVSSAPAPEEEREEDLPFAFLRTEVLSGSRQPTLCLVFSELLDSTRDYEPYVAIDREVALAAKDKTLCVEGLSYGEEATLTLRAGLPSREGEELARDEEVTLTFSDRPPVVQFAGSGIVLPRDGAGGVGVQTINVDEVAVAITRLNDRALTLRRITEGYAGGEGVYQYVPFDERPGELGDPIFEGTLLTEGPRNTLTTTLLPIEESLGELEAGAYYIELEDQAALERGENQPARAARWVVVTDLAMTAYRSQGSLDVVLRSLSNASPMGGVQVRLVAQSNEVLATERSNRQGRVTFPAPLLRGEEGNRPKLIVAESRGGEFAFLDLDRAPLDLSALDVGGRMPAEGTEAFVTTERGVYRPGETVHLTALLRDEAGRASDGQPGHIVVLRPNGTEQQRLPIQRWTRAGSVVRDIMLPEAASRGRWQAVVELEGLGKVGAVSFSVDDFVPQRLALDLSADDAPLGLDEDRTIRADARFLYGAPGSGLRVFGTVRVEEDPRPFQDFEAYGFGLHDEPFRGKLIELGTQTTDGAGTADLTIEGGALPKMAAAPLRLRTVIRVEEPGGRAVQDDLRIPYRPAAFYPGIKPRFEGTVPRGGAAGFDIVAVGPDGALQQEELAYRLVRRDFDYDWYQERGGRWRWRRFERLVPVADGLIETITEEAVPLDTRGLPWGDYVLTLAQEGRDLSSYGFYVGYGGRTESGTPAPDQVRVWVSDEAPAIGEDVTVSIVAPYAGRGEVAVAAGEIVEIRPFVTDGSGFAEITLTASDDWDRGAYLLASVFTEREPGVVPVPRRAVGAVYVPLDRSRREREVRIEAPRLIRPGQKATLTVLSPGSSRKPIYAAIAAVDEGILALTKYETPDPAEALFGKPRLVTSIYDDYGRVLDPDTGQLGELRSGGDAIGGAGLSVVPTKTVALFSGPIELTTGGAYPSPSATFELDIPDFAGELRVMALVWSEEAVGSASRAVTVRDEVAAELVLPRFLAPGDQALATLSVDNVEGEPGEYSFELTGEGPLQASAEQRFELEQGERSDRAVEVSGTGVGVARLEFVGTGPDFFQTERSYDIELRSAFLPERRTLRRVLEPGESWSVPEELLAGLEVSSASLLVSASPTPIDRRAVARSLTSYPYACTEQLVSRATALLTDPRRSTEDTGRLQRIIETILERQSPDGAFGMWRVGDRGASPWIGAYTVDMLMEAQRQNLPVPDSALERAYLALQPVSQGELFRAYGYDGRISRAPWTIDTQEALDERSSAYALYVLAKAGLADRSRLRYLHDARLSRTSSALAKAHLAGGLAAIGDAGRARNAFTAAIDDLGYQNDGDYYQTPLRDAAAAIELLAEAGEDERARKLWDQTAEETPEPEGLTTQESAFLLRASDAFAGGRTNAFVTYDGSRFESVVLKEQEIAGAPFTNDSDRPVTVTASLSGHPSSPPPATASGLEVRKELLTLEGRAAEAELNQGDRVLIVLTVRPSNVREAQLVVTDLLPAGLEIETVLGPGDAADSSPFAFLGMLSETSIAEKRDDRFVASLTKRGEDILRFAYIARAVTPGDFAFPGAVAEDMYRLETFGRSESGRLTVAP